MRKKVIAGNWKMNMLPNEAINFIEELAPLVKDTENEVVLCVPFTDLFYALLTAQNTNIKIGAQNMHFEESGAYTGEVSGKMLKSINVEYVIIGHSERRQYFNETDETVIKKMKAAFPKHYINTFSYLTKKEFESDDGVHYYTNTYKELYNYVLTKV